MSTKPALARKLKLSLAELHFSLSLTGHLMIRSLLALLTLLLVLQLPVQGQTDSSRLTAKQLTRAEDLIIQLEQLPTVGADLRGFVEYKGRIKKLSAIADKTLSKLPVGNVKTDIATAVYLYELAAADSNHLEGSGSATSRCASEKPGAYQSLCESTSGSRRELLLAKAALHVSWGKASIKFQKTGRDDSTIRGDMEAERSNDQALVRRAISALKVLESEVVVYNSRGDFEESLSLARVPFRRFMNDLRRASAEVEIILVWLPQSRLKFELGNSLHSYQDGAFWWQRIYDPRVVNASDLVSPEVTRTPSDAAYLATVPYTIAINWRQGSKYLKRAEETLKR